MNYNKEIVILIIRNLIRELVVGERLIISNNMNSPFSLIGLLRYWFRVYNLGYKERWYHGY